MKKRRKNKSSILLFNHSIMKKILWTILLFIILWWCIRSVKQKSDRLDFWSTKDTTENWETIANPASINCLDNGGTLEMRANKKGQYGVCMFEDNRQCEEWALMHGDCPVGGLKITGYENEAEVYCAIAWGELSWVGTPTPMCKRVDGTWCNAQANMDGDCPNQYDPNPDAGNGPDV